MIPWPVPLWLTLGATMVISPSGPRASTSASRGPSTWLALVEARGTAHQPGAALLAHRQYRLEPVGQAEIDGDIERRHPVCLRHGELGHAVDDALGRLASRHGGHDTQVVAAGGQP